MSRNSVHRTNLVTPIARVCCSSSYAANLFRRLHRLALGAVLLALGAAAPVASRAQTVVFQGVINTVAGNGSEENSSSVVDNVLATSTDVGLPEDVKLDAAGNIYIVDWSGSRIRKVSATTGIITTVAGGGSGCAGQTDSEGDGCLGTQASLNSPAGIALDAAGNLYIADNGAHVVRKVTAATGIITIVAGTYNDNGYTGDGGLATSATLNRPTGVAIDSAGNIYIADYLNDVVRVVNTQSTTATILGVSIPAGDIQTVAGNGSGTCGTATDSVGDGCPDIDANSLLYPQAVALDASGNLYIAENEGYRVRKITAATGIITTVIGNGNRGFSGDGAAATSAQVSFLDGVALDSSGNIYITDGGNLRVRVVNTQSTAITIGGVTIPAGDVQTLAGNGTDGYADYLPPTEAEFSRISSAPGGLTVDGSGNIYLADYGNNRIREVQFSTVNFGWLDVNQTSPTYTLGFAFTGSTTLSGDAVVTQGATGMDYQSASGSTCAATTYTSGESCSVNVTLDPLYPGLRQGALSFSNAGSETYIEFLKGVGIGPMLDFAQGSGTTVFLPGSYNDVGSGNTYSFIGGTAVDPNHNIYFANWNGEIDYTTAASNYQTITKIASASVPWRIVLDGAGDVIWYDLGSGSILEAVAVNGVIPSTPTIVTLASGLSLGVEQPGLAIDGQGDIYFSSLSGGFQEIVAVGGGIPATPTIRTIPTSRVPGPMAFDQNGNLFFGTEQNGATGCIYEISPVNGQIPNSPNIQTVYCSLSAQGLAVDAAGNIWEADFSGAAGLQEIEAVNGVIPASPTIVQYPYEGPTGTPEARDVGLDANGNVFVSYYLGASSILQFDDFRDPPSFTWTGTTPIGQTNGTTYTAEAQERGNAPLLLPIPSSGLNPSINPNWFWDTGAANACPTVSDVTNPGTLAVSAWCDLTVSFAPLADGSPLTGQLTLTDNDLNASSGAMQSINLSGYSNGQPASATLTPSSNDFSSQPEGTASQAFGFTFTSTSSTAISNINPTFTGANPGDFQVVYGNNACPSALAGNSSCTIWVQFTPSLIGPESATLSVSSSAANSPQTATVSGTGTTPPPPLSPANLNFGGVQIYSTSFQLVETVTNVSSGTLNIGEVGLSGSNSANFALATGNNPCTSNLDLNSGASCNLYVTFTPTLLGAANASLDIEDIGSVPLTGNGISFNEPVGSSQAAQSVSVMIQNAGELAGINALAAGDQGADFTIQSGGTCTSGATLAQGALCTVNVVFTPQYTGARQGAILLTDDSQRFLGATFLSGFGTGAQMIFNPVTPTTLVGYTVSLTGIAVDAKDDVFYFDSKGNLEELPFSSSGYGSPALIANEQTFTGTTTIYSMALDGAGDIFFGAPSEGDSFELPSTGSGTWGSFFSISQATGTPYQSAFDSFGNLYYLDIQNGIYQVPYAGSGGTGYGPQSALPFPSTTTMSYDGIAVDSGQNVYAIGQNNSTGQTQLIVLPFSGTGYGSPITTTIGQLASGGSLAVDTNGDVYASGLINSTNGAIYFLPATTGFGTYGTPVLVATGLYGNFVLDGAGNIFAVQANLSHQAQIVEIPQATPPSFTFANTNVGSTSTDSPQSVTVWDVGTDTLDFNSVTYPTDFPDASFSTTQCNAEYPVAASASCTISINFTPTASGSLSEDVILVDDALNGNRATQNIPVSGNGNGASPTASLTGIAFGNQTKGSTSTAMSATLSNTSGTALSNISISIAGANAADFALTTGANGCGTSLAANSSCSIWVTFTPSLVGAESAQLSVSDNATGSPQISALTGTGVAPVPPAAPIASLSPTIAFGNQTQGTASAAMSATLSNTGNAALAISGITITGANAADFAIATGSNACGSSLAAGSNCLIYVTFTPSTSAAESATLNVADNAAGSPQTSALTGTGVVPAAPVASLSPSVAFGNQALDTASSALTATLSNTGNAALSISGITITGANAGDFTLSTGSNACGNSLAAASSCLIYVTFTPGTTAAESATLNVVDNAAGSPQTSALTGTGMSVQSGYGVNSPTPPQTAQPGGSAQYTINVAPNPVGDFFNNPVTLSASGLPAGATASFNPPAVTPGTSGAPSTMTIQLPATFSKMDARPSPARWPVLPTSLAIGLGGAWTLFRRRRRARIHRWLSHLLLAFALGAVSLIFTSCGGGFALLQPTSYTITVTGTSGSLTQTTTVQLTVQ